MLALLLGVGVLAGCGQKGDLYLPDETPEDAARR
ncbi:MAG: lipoprotein [Gammaproteobacteria bacterium]